MCQHTLARQFRARRSFPRPVLGTAQVCATTSGGTNQVQTGGRCPRRRRPFPFVRRSLPTKLQEMARRCSTHRRPGPIAAAARRPRDPLRRRTPTSSARCSVRRPDRVAPRCLRRARPRRQRRHPQSRREGAQRPAAAQGRRRLREVAKGARRAARFTQGVAAKQYTNHQGDARLNTGTRDRWLFAAGARAHVPSFLMELLDLK